MSTHAELASDPSRRVLVVDDDADIREVARLTLTMLARWQVDVAADGAEAVESAIRTKPDAIVLDMMMPDLDGIATMRQLQERPATREIPVILMTAKTNARTGALDDALGAAGVITKPFDPMTLPDQIRAMLGWAL